MDKCHDLIFAPSRVQGMKKKHTFMYILRYAKGNPDIEERVLYIDEENMVVMNIFPYSRGHLEVVPVKITPP